MTNEILSVARQQRVSRRCLLPSPGSGTWFLTIFCTGHVVFEPIDVSRVLFGKIRADCSQNFSRPLCLATLSPTSVSGLFGLRGSCSQNFLQFFAAVLGTPYFGRHITDRSTDDSPRSFSGHTYIGAGRHVQGPHSLDRKGGSGGAHR